MNQYSFTVSITDHASGQTFSHRAGSLPLEAILKCGGPGGLKEVALFLSRQLTCDALRSLADHKLGCALQGVLEHMLSQKDDEAS